VSESELRILYLLRDHPWSTAHQVAGLVNLPLRSVQRYLSNLLSAGLVQAVRVPRDFLTTLVVPGAKGLQSAVSPWEAVAWRTTGGWGRWRWPSKDSNTYPCETHKAFSTSRRSSPPSLRVASEGRPTGVPAPVPRSTGRRRAAGTGGPRPRRLWIIAPAAGRHHCLRRPGRSPVADVPVFAFLSRGDNILAADRESQSMR
jgi:hypothetical protein